MLDVRNCIAIIASTVTAALSTSLGNANADPVSVTAFNTFHVQNPPDTLQNTPNPIPVPLRRQWRSCKWVRRL